MAEEDLRKIASLLRKRNVIDEKIAAVIHRPMTAGHLGEWIASQVFGIELATSAVAAAIDGRFRARPTTGPHRQCEVVPQARAVFGPMPL
jgi:hypothetical protein